MTGVTSNPSIFEKAIGGSDDYGAALKSALKQGDRDVMSLYEALAIADIRSAADALLPVYKATKGLDGYVSLEVSLSRYGHRRDGGGGAAPVARSFVRQSDDQRARDRRGPADDPPPDRRKHHRHITLLFSQEVYERVVAAYLGGLEDLLAHGGDPSKVASVASFFVSRIDVEVDKRFDDKIKSGRKALSSLRGEVAIANAKLAYQRDKRLFAGSRWDKLQSQGARTQRLLWAGIGTKNKDYSDGDAPRVGDHIEIKAAE